MRFAARELAILLSACMFAGTSGCAPAARWAEVARDRVAPGMTENQVRDELGEPVQIVQGDPGQPVLWIYRFESGPTTVGFIVLVILFAGFIVLGVLAGHASLNFSGDTADEDLAEFQVQFDARGVVTGISPIVIVRRNP